MKSIFYLEDITCAISHNYICNEIKKIQGINNIYYNHLFSSFFVDYDEEMDVISIFSNMQIKVSIFEDITLVVEKILSKEKLIKKILIFSLIIFLLQIINIFVPYSLIQFKNISNLIFNLLISLTSYKLIRNTINEIKIKLINDLSVKLIIFVVTVCLFGMINIVNSSFILFSIFASSIIVIQNIYNYLIVIYKKKLFKKKDLSLATAIVKRDNKEVEVSLNEIMPDDIIISKDKTIIPLNGSLIDGFTQVDQSMYTSEVPIVSKIRNNSVVAGMVNQSQYRDFINSSNNEKNTINTKYKLILDSTSSKNSLSHSLKFFYEYFHYILLIVGILSFIVYFIYTKTINPSLLILLSLSLFYNYEIFEYIVPLKTFDFIKKISEEGIFIKNTKSIEKINNCEVIMFEKHGVLIEDYPEVKDVFISEGIKPSDFYYIAYMLVKDSNSKYAITIKNYLKNIHLSSLDPEQVKNTNRKGIAKDKIIKDYQYGNYKFCKNKNINLAKVEPSIKRFQIQGKNSIIFTHKNEIIGILTIQSILRDDVKSTIDILNNQNKRIILLDNSEPEITKYYASKLNIKEYYSNLNINQKSRLVDSLYLEGNKTIYVSNIKNNKKFPENTDVNISFSQDINFEIKEADIIVTRSDIKGLLNIMENSKQTIKEITNQISLFIQVYGLLILLSLLLTLFVYITPYFILIIVTLLPISLFIYYTNN